MSYGPFVIPSEYISERVIHNVDRTMSSMLENGLFRFYETYSAFLMKLHIAQMPTNQTDKYIVTKEQMRIPLIMYLLLTGFASLFFVVEIIIQRMKKAKQSRQ